MKIKNSCSNWWDKMHSPFDGDSDDDMFERRGWDKI